MKKVPHLPHSITAEQAVIGSLMLDNEQWDAVIEHIVMDDFYLNAHKILFREMQQLVLSQTPIDLLTLSESLEQKGELDKVGGFAYLAELAKNTPSAVNAENYAKYVSDYSKARQLIQLGAYLNQQAIKGKEIPLLIEQAEQQLFRIAEKQAAKTPDLSESFNHFLLNLEKRVNADNEITGTPTGFARLDKITCGLQNSDLILLAGRPSMGKTAFGLALTIAALQSGNGTVQMYSLEMPTESVLMRLIAMLGRIPLHHLRSGAMTTDDLTALGPASQTILSWKDRLLIDDNSDVTPALLRSRVRRNIRKYGQPSLILIDYLQMMRCPSNENRTQEISEISRSLKALAKEANAPIVALSQLSRNLEQRVDKRPMNSDLRDSGALEQDADVILLIYRDEVYHPETNDKGIAEIIIGKQRQGAIGTINVRYQADITRFEDMGGQR